MGTGFNVALSISGSAVREIHIGNSQDQGRRPYQEDSFGFTDLSADTVAKIGFAAVVSDGMGGLSGSEAVSSYTISAIQQMYKALDLSSEPHKAFINMANSINTAISNQRTGGGATLVAVCCSPKGVFWCSVGDSRAYLYRSGKLFQLTQDLDYINTLLDDVIDGKMTFEKADNAPKRDSLAQYIGSGEVLSPDVNIKPFIPESGDKLLLCSDGVYNALEQDEMSALMNMNAQNCSDALTSAVLAKQYENQDNLTNIVLEFI